MCDKIDIIFGNFVLFYYVCEFRIISENFALYLRICYYIWEFRIIFGYFVIIFGNFALYLHVCYYIF
jgi:hypothetical protein